MEQRYRVVEVKDMLIGTMFQVIDVFIGKECGEPKYFRDQAESLARRLNLYSA